LKEFEIKLCDF